MLGQENISHGRGKQLVEFANLLQSILSNMANYREKSVFITSFFNVWEENILSLGEEMQEDLGKVTYKLLRKSIACVCIRVLCSATDRFFELGRFSTQFYCSS